MGNVIQMRHSFDWTWVVGGVSGNDTGVLTLTYTVFDKLVSYGYEGWLQRALSYSGPSLGHYHLQGEMVTKDIPLALHMATKNCHCIPSHNEYYYHQAPPLPWSS